ncbi:hypothetical protein ACLOJK_033068 [Asimina triloba]
MQPNLLLPSLLSFFCLFLAFYALPSSCQDDFYLYTECAPFSYRCGTETYDIRYPFLVVERSQSCGFPGYRFECTENTLTTNISSVLYNVKSIDYQSNILTVSRRDFTGQTCPVESTMTESMYYNVSSEVQNLTLYYGCPRVAISSGFYQLPCFNESDLFAYFTFETGLGVPAAGFVDCETSVMQILASEEDRLKEEPSAFAQVLEQGFNVMWIMGAQWCKQCVDSGGRCGYVETQYAEPTCFCRDDIHVTPCPPLRI